MNPGSPNRETDIAYEGGQVAALIGKGCHQLEKTTVHVSNEGTKQECANKLTVS